MVKYRRYKSKETTDFLSSRGVLGDDMTLWGIYYRAIMSLYNKFPKLYAIRLMISSYKDSIWNAQKRELYKDFF